MGRKRILHDGHVTAVRCWIGWACGSCGWGWSIQGGWGHASQRRAATLPMLQYLLWGCGVMARVWV